MGLNKEQDELIAALYLEMYTQLCIYAMNALDDRSLAEEAVQDAFRIACAKADDLLSSVNPKGWIMNTLKNVIRNIRKTRSRWNNLVVTSLSADCMELVTSDCDTDFNVVYSDLLEEEDFALLEMIVIKKYTMLEAANKIGISIDACKKRVQRAKKKLRELLEENN